MRDASKILFLLHINRDSGRDLCVCVCVCVLITNRGNSCRIWPQSVLFLFLFFSHPMLASLMSCNSL